VATAPSSELSALGIGKETVAGTAVIPTLFVPAQDASLAGTNGFHDRPAPRRHLGRTEPATGMFTGKGSATIEAEPAPIAAFLLLTLGAETVTPNAGNPTTGGSATTTTAATAIGATVIPFTSATGYIAGGGFRVDAGLATQEDFIVTSVAANNVTVTTAAKFAHATGAAIAPAVLAQDHTFTLQSPRPTFTAQQNVVIETKSAAGCKMSTLDLTVDPKNIVLAKCGWEYCSEAEIGSPTTPAYPALFPYVFESTQSLGTVNGVASDASIQGFTVSINTGLITEYPALGSGRYRPTIPESITTVSGTMDLAFETTTMRHLFWGNSGATAPQSIVASVAITIVVASQDSINANVQHQMKIVIAKAKLTDLGIDPKMKDYIKQSVKFECYESAIGANDDLRVVVTNASSAASL
jgi:hypothetical protein